MYIRFGSDSTGGCGENVDGNKSDMMMMMAMMMMMMTTTTTMTVMMMTSTKS